MLATTSPLHQRSPRNRSDHPARAAPSLLGIIALIGILQVSAKPAAAQQSTSTLIGVVTGANATPIANAQIVVLGTRLGTLTRDGGHFQLVGIPAGSQTVEVHFAGYQTLQLPLDFEPGEPLHMQIALVVSPVEVEGVEVTAARAHSAEMEGFYHRRGRGSGHFFTREQIGEMQVRVLTDVLRRVPGIRIEPMSGPFGTSDAARIGRTNGIAGQRSCPVLYYVNGVPFPVPSNVGINAYIRPNDVAGLEVYSGASRIPAQFNSTMHNSRCGVVVIWTYGGEKRNEPRGS